MTNSTSSPNQRSLLRFAASLVITLFMGIATTVLDVRQPAEPILSILAFIPGLVSIAALSASGLRWAWQVQRDRTVVWAMVQHSLFLVVMSMFAWA